MNHRTFESFQKAVQAWLAECFDDPEAVKTHERACRFIEEAVELVQSLNFPKESILSLVDHVYNKPPGELYEEAGGTLTTLAALLSSVDASLETAANNGIDRAYTKIALVRAKHKAKMATQPGSPLPGKAPFGVVSGFEGARYLVDSGEQAKPVYTEGSYDVLANVAVSITRAYDAYHIFAVMDDGKVYTIKTREATIEQNRFVPKRPKFVIGFYRDGIKTIPLRGAVDTTQRVVGFYDEQTPGTPLFLPLSALSEKGLA